MGGSGNQTTQGSFSSGLQGWAEPVAKAVLGSYLNYIFPGATVPSGWFNTQGFTFPSGSPNASSGGGGGNAAQQMLAQIDPTGTAYSMFSPMISGSPFLQNMAQSNPGAVVGAISPMAASQFSNPNLYGSSSQALGWIPGFHPGLQTAGSSQVG